MDYAALSYMTLDASKSPSDVSIAQLQQQLRDEREQRMSAEERIRKVVADYKRLEKELVHYRDHFEVVVAARTAELEAINEKLRRENLERRMAERERRSFEDQFREASLMLEAMLDAIPDIIGVQDNYHRIIRLNKAGYKFFERTEDQVLGKHCFEMIGQQAPCDQCVHRLILETNQPAQIEKYIDAKGVWMDIRAYPIRDTDGRVFRIVEHWRDITDLKRSEASLVESEEKYRLLVENAKESIFIYQDGQFKFSNRRAREMARKLNLSLTRQLTDYIYADDLGDDTDYYQRRLNGHDPAPYAISFRLMDLDSETIWVELNTVNITWQGRQATLNFVRDITQGKVMEHRFQEMQRMESLGTLAGGIAHDFNNLLMGIQGNVSLMYLDIENDPALMEKLKSIEDCVDSGSRLTKQLLGFARGGKYVVKPMDMNQILHNSAEMFGRTRKAIKIHGNYQKDLWTVMVDRSQIEQVLVNLFLNAQQAMHGSGDLYLKTSNIITDKKFARVHEVPAGQYVLVSVADTGIGMDETIQRRIFEPFFTTNELGRGTGLGLASVFGIIKNHNGAINVRSRPGQGSTFEVYLPATGKDPEIESPSAEPIELGSETILLVDDESYIIEVARLMLESLGYVLLTACSGRAALKVFADHQETIDLVILDMVMPDMDGESVFESLRAIRPDIKVIFASGYYVMEQTSTLLKEGFCDFLQKPFNLQQLSSKIRAMLDKT